MLACGLIGLQASKKYSKRLVEVREIINVLPQVTNGIKFLQLPLGEILQKVSKGLSANLKSVFQQTADNLLEFGALESFKNALKSNHVYLNENDKEKLTSLFALIGKASADEETRAIESTIQSFKIYEKEAHEQDERYSKMCRTLGICGGLIIIIIIL